VVFTYTAAALKPTADLIRNLEPLIQDELLAPAEIEQKLSKRFRLLGTQGLVGIALSAIDMALWDALARSLGVPLVCLLRRHSTDAARNAAQAGWLVSLRRSTMLGIRRFGPQSRQFLDRLCDLLADAAHSGVVASRRAVPATPPPRA
jgi:L-alanine-DL-glutamate epimerase-like enolase superfamily enzyme